MNISVCHFEVAADTTGQVLLAAVSNGYYIIDWIILEAVGGTTEAEVFFGPTEAGSCVLCHLSSDQNIFIDFRNPKTGAGLRLNENVELRMTTGVGCVGDITIGYHLNINN